MRVSVGHFEILARDPERLARFFREALGWSAEPVPWDGPAYLKLRPAAETAPPARQVGGGILGDAADQAPLLVFHLDEGTLEEALARIEAAGGSIGMPPEEVGGKGRFARFRDPDGRGYGRLETYPGKGNYATTLWAVSTPFCDRYTISAGKDLPAPAAARVTVSLLNGVHGKPLPVKNATGHPAGTTADIPVKVQATTPAP